MRNWNNRPKCPDPSGMVSFYFTYEELKHQSGQASGPDLFSFLLYLWGIETNLLVMVLYFFRPVFTLPMRNWNCIQLFLIQTPNKFLLYLWGIETRYRMRSLLHERLTFLLYLWGIETPKSKLAKTLYALFLLYLWGIETIIYAMMIFIVIMSFYFTYEELKHMLFDLKISRKRVFTLPMRNWNKIL